MVIDHEIPRLVDKFKITPQKKHGKYGWVINGKTIAQVLRKKGDKIHRVNKDNFMV